VVFDSSSVDSVSIPDSITSKDGSAASLIGVESESSVVSASFTLSLREEESIGLDGSET